MIGIRLMNSNTSAAHTPMFAPKDTPLKHEVNMLGALLGEVLIEQGGTLLYDNVEKSRQLARRRRQGDQHAGQELSQLLSDLRPDLASEVTRAFAAYFGLVNMAERVHRIRRRRDYMRPGSAPQPGGFVAVLTELKNSGITAAELQDVLDKLQITPVFTAHPTEATRRTLLVKEQRIARALIDQHSQQNNLVPHELDAIIARIRNEVTSAWQTEELSVQPSVADEAEHVAFYLSDVVYRIVPVFYEAFADALSKVYGPECAAKLPAVMVRFGSWVGGDMDGNPNVGANTIIATLKRQRSLILKRYISEARELFDHLSQSTSRVEVSSDLVELCNELRALLPQAAEQIPTRYANMPYRAALWLMIVRLAATEQDEVGAYADPQELRRELEILHSSLLTHKGQNAGCFRVQRMLRRVDTFGFHLATLDLRQDALVHRRVVGHLLNDAQFVDRPSAERTALLESALSQCYEQGPRSIPSNLSSEQAAEIERVLAVMRAIAECRRKLGHAAVGPYIISMAQGADDALALLFLAAQGGLLNAQGEIALDIAPLFETVPDLQNAASIMRALYEQPIYRQHLSQRNNAQLIMLGYSDSNKESGLTASRWALQEAQRQLVTLSQNAKVDLSLFHGRGGTASRGGSKPRNAILAEPPGAVMGKLRLTEQGEIIHAKYGLRDIALRTLELMSGAVMEVTLRSKNAAPLPAEWTAAMSYFAEQSRAEYRRLVYENPDFYTYFREATPIDVIERLRIGSRPAARRSNVGIENLRAIPWVFAWTQNRQSLPGWYGVGYGLEKTVEQFGLPLLQEMILKWPYLANLVSDVEMVLAKADLPIGAMYAKLAGPVGESIFGIITQEFERTRGLLCSLQNTTVLLEREPTLQRAIKLRNPYVDPMSLVQVDLLKRWRASDRQDPDLERALMMTVKGIARGLQNTG